MRMRSVAIEKHKAAKTSTKSTATRSSTPSKLALIDNVLKETADHCFILRCCHWILSFSATFGNSVDRVVGKTDSQESSPNRVPANEWRSVPKGRSPPRTLRPLLERFSPRPTPASVTRTKSVWHRHAYQQRRKQVYLSHPKRHISIASVGQKASLQRGRFAETT